MNKQEVLRSLSAEHFIKIANKGEWFEDGAVIYAREIRENIFLLFVILKDVNIENVKALIAHFDSFKSIGVKEPLQVMFYLSIKEKEDLHYFEKYLQVPNN